MYECIPSMAVTLVASCNKLNTDMLRLKDQLKTRQDHYNCE